MTMKIKLDEIDDLDFSIESVGSSKIIMTFKEIKTNMKFEIELERSELEERLMEIGDIFSQNS